MNKKNFKIGNKIIFMDIDMQFAGEIATISKINSGTLSNTSNAILDKNGTETDGMDVLISNTHRAFLEDQIRMLQEAHNKTELLHFLQTTKEYWERFHRYMSYDKEEAEKIIMHYEKTYKNPYPSNNFKVNHILAQLDNDLNPCKWEGKEQTISSYSLPYN